MTQINSYALLIGLGLGIMTLLALRHPPFAILITLVSIFGLDYYLKNRKPKNIDKSDD